MGVVGGTDISKTIEEMQEQLTLYMGVIGSDHAYVHKGIAFTAVINTGSISAAYDIAFTTPVADDDKYIHWRPVGISTSADYVDVKLYEGDAFTGGTAVTPINRNRNFSSASAMQAFVQGATVTPAGTVIQSLGVGATGTPNARSGGGSAADQELVLKPDTDYVLTLTPDSATTCILELFWYEEPGFRA